MGSGKCSNLAGVQLSGVIVIESIPYFGKVLMFVLHFIILWNLPILFSISSHQTEQDYLQKGSMSLTRQG